MRFRVFLAIFCAFWPCVVAQAERGDRQRGGGKGAERKKKLEGSPQKIALEAWAESLSERDYSPDEWKIMFHSKTSSDFFNAYAKKLSKIFKASNAKVNFAMVGACDGTGDNTIKYIYLPNDHWRGVFVEPMSLNVRDLVTFMSTHNVTHRSVVIKAAATLECKEPTIKIERPLYEEKNKNTPHWLRRQISSILPATRDHARNEWQIEEVKCVTGRDILQEWSVKTNGNWLERTSKGDAENNIPEVRKRRPHVLKIDVEGHDFEVLMSFLSFDTPVTDLPLLIDFEGKSIAKKYPVAKERMEALGYAVSPFGNDGFAILRASKVKEAIDILFKPREGPRAEREGGEGSGGRKERMNKKFNRNKEVRDQQKAQQVE